MKIQSKPSIPVFLRQCLALLLLSLGSTACQHQTTGASEGPAPKESGEHYAKTLGQRYRTKTDLYLFIFGEDFDFKYLGKKDDRLASLPADVSKAHVGYVYGNIMIVGFVPAGSVFTIEAETHEITNLSGLRDKGGIPMGFICKLAYDGREEDSTFSEFIQRARSAPAGALNQEIDPAVAEKLDE